MKKLIVIGGVGLLVGVLALAKEKLDPAATEVWEPVPVVVTPGVGSQPPSDAIVLFDGTDMSAWDKQEWTVEDGVMTVKPGTGKILTRQHFGSVQLHIEWRSPALVGHDGQDRGNSGVFFQDRYEVQILDSFESETYPNGQAASVYKQSIPLVNASRPPMEWQSYDIVFNAPEFAGDSDRVVRPASVTVFHNGVLVQNHFELTGPTKFIGKPEYTHHGKGPIRLQDHNSLVSFRNIWVREL